MLASIDDLRNSLDREVSDARGYSALQAASAAIKAACRWPIEMTEETKRVQLDGCRPIFLPTLHLVEVTSITAADVLLSPISFAWTDDGRVFGALPGACWPLVGYGPVVVAVSFRHGYDPVPDEVRAACVDLAAARLSNPPGGQAVRSQSEGIGSYSHAVTYASGGDAETDQRLAAYRMPPVVA